MKKVFNDYMNNKLKLEKYQIVGILGLIVVFSGIFGWVYEFIFYFFDSGMKRFTYQGGNFLPWINIYATGAILIILTTRKIKKKPLLVFLISVLVTGLLEYISGFLIYHLCDGLRLWDYNIEILNFGNIDGFVCLRSVLFFGVSSFLLMYAMLPFCIFLSKKMKKKSFLIVSISLFSVVMFDELYNLIFARIFHLPRAYDIYHGWGIK
jgi:uncharacterized membrane protein